jgi:hypothetical protein
MMDSGDSQVVRVFIGLLGVGLIVLKIWFRGRKTVTRPDGTLETAEDEAATAVSTPRKRQIGPTTVSFAYINQRHAMVNSMKQKYGNAVRIVHRGRKSEWDLLTGFRNLYTLIYEVPAKCPKCKETFSIEDFGFVDCPGCGLELAVGFDDVTQKKMVMPANSEALVAPRPQRPASAPLAEADAREESNDPIADRFGKIE